MLTPSPELEKLAEAIGVVQRVNQLDAAFPNLSQQTQIAYVMEFAELLIAAEAYLDRVWLSLPSEVGNEIIQIAESYKYN